MSIDRWSAIHLQIVKERDAARLPLDEVRNALIRRLKELAAPPGKHCSPHVQGWFTTEPGEGRRRELTLKGCAGKKDPRGRPAIELKGLEHLEDGALLTLWVLLDTGQERVLAYSIQIQGETRRPKRPWYARIDLDETLKGTGPCAHPLLHLHVGVA